MIPTCLRPDAALLRLSRGQVRFIAWVAASTWAWQTWMKLLLWSLQGLRWRFKAAFPARSMKTLHSDVGS